MSGFKKPNFPQLALRASKHVLFISGPVKLRDQTLRHIRESFGADSIASDLCAEQDWTMGRAFFIESSAAGSR